MKMIKRVLLAGASGALALGMFDMRASGAERGDSRRLDDRYSVIWQRSIFLRERRGYIPSGPRTDAESSTRQAISLTGTSLADRADLGGAVYTAFIEDGRSGDTRLLKVGDSVGGGKVLDIGIEYVDFEIGGRPRRITVGMNFEGAAVGRGFGRGGPGEGRYGEGRPGESGAPTSQPSTGVATTPPPSTDAAAPSGGTVSEIEARMRAKRAQELGK